MQRLESCAYPEFLSSHLLENSPCIISSKLVDDWPCLTRWKSDSGGVNWDYLSAIYGDRDVCVADCGTREFSDQKRHDMLLRDAIEVLKSHPKNPDLRSPYIKDWHLVMQSSELVDVNDRLPYHPPNIFVDDWLNNVPEGQDDFRFCYAGVAGTFTPLHRDVYTSYSWSTNIVGMKRWYFYPPDVAHLLRRDPARRRSELIYDVRDVDTALFPGWAQAREREICVEQKAGETIFVPSGWYHQVINLTDCISLNHNWCNACNLPSLYESMKEATEDVHEAISDVRELLRARASSLGSGESKSSPKSDEWKIEWHREVEKLLKLDAGWGWEGFFRMIAYNIDPDTVVAPEHLRPHPAFVHDRVRLIVQDFEQREEYEHVPEIRAAVDAVRQHLLNARSDSAPVQ